MPSASRTLMPSHSCSRVLQEPGRFRCFSRTSMSASADNCHQESAFAPDVARHQKVAERADFKFDYRRCGRSDWLVTLGVPGAGSGASAANRRSTFSVILDTLLT